MKKSPNDIKDYQTTTLANGLRVLLIHNQETKKSAAALAVNVGHFNDPKSRQGMAHFLEHMLFLGTEKYPDGSEYQKFISQHGGSHNAWTATEHTCFFFDIQQDYFSCALKRFSQFFIAPLLSKEFINKERQNIDAEFKLKLKDDIRRLYDVHKETINQAHPFSQFSVGNLDTLADREGKSIQAELIDFYTEFYRAGYMTLALEGPQTLPELELLAQSLFSDIPAAEKPLTKINQPLYLANNQQIYVKVDPVKNDRQLIVSFAMPSIDRFYRHKPESILAYLIGHEGPGSILSLLKKNQWAMGLTAGSGINGSNFKDFNINITLTEQGEQHIDDIIEVLFSYLLLLKSKPIPEYFYQEKQSIAELSFTYHEKSRPLDSVSQLAINMQHYPCDDYIFGDYIMTGMCNDSITELLDYLCVTNMRIIHISKNNQFNQTSFWYQVPYQVNKISDSKLNHWQQIKADPALFLPPENPYILGNPPVYKDKSTTSTPLAIEKQDGLTIWYKQDTVFQVPKGYIYIGIDSPIAIASTQNIAMTRLLVELYSDSLIEENYDAELAGMHYHLYAHQGGITLQLSGISEKQAALLAKLIQSLQNHQIPEAHFELLKQQMICQWKNADKSKSISQLFATLSATMQPFNPSSDSLWQALSKINFQQFIQFIKQFFNKITIEVLIHGNWRAEHAQAISQTIKTTFFDRYSAKNAIKYPMLDIRQQGELIFPMTLADHDHACVIYYPQADKSLATIAHTMITNHLLSPLFFQEMRTEKQYGYLVGVGYIPINRYPGIAFYIQSPHTEATTLITAIDDFINNCLNKLDNMTKKEWQQLQQGLAGQLSEKDSSLRIKSQRFWSDICNNEAKFNLKEQLVNVILTVTLDEIKFFISHSLFKSAKTDRIILMSQTEQALVAEKDISATVIDNIANFCQNCPKRH